MDELEFLLGESLPYTIENAQISPTLCRQPSASTKSSKRSIKIHDVSFLFQTLETLVRTPTIFVFFLMSDELMTDECGNGNDDFPEKEGIALNFLIKFLFEN